MSAHAEKETKNQNEVENERRWGANHPALKLHGGALIPRPCAHRAWRRVTPDERTQTVGIGSGLFSTQLSALRVHC